MTSFERRLPLAAAVRFGWWEFVAANPAAIVLGALIPRAVLQCLFFTVLSQVVRLDDTTYAFVGGLAGVLALSGAAAVADVLMLDKISGTGYRVRSAGGLSFLIIAARSIPYVLLGFAFTVASLVVVAPITGHLTLLPKLVPWLPTYLVMAVTTCAAGLAGAALAIGRRAEAIACNLIAYLVLLCTGVFLPPERYGWLEAIGYVLPIRHGLLAVRHGLNGQPWLGELALWFAAAWLITLVQTRRARSSGHDDFA